MCAVFSIQPAAESTLRTSGISARNLPLRPKSWMCIAGYEEGLMLKNITSRLLSQAVQDSMPDVGLVPTYQNCSVCKPPGIYHMFVYL